MTAFPIPIGGTPYPLDFAPSILFAVLYAAILPLVIHRMLNKTSRTILLLGTALFCIERIYVYTLRAVQSQNEKARLLPGFVTYMQLSFAMGFIGVAGDMVNVLRCLLVNPTYGAEMYYQSPAAATKGKAGVCSPPPPGTPDQPELRRSLRRITSVLGLAFLSSYVTGVIAQAYYSSAFTDQMSADKSQRLRLVSTFVAMLACIAVITVTGWSTRRFPQNSKRPGAVLGSVSTLMAIVAIYRVSVMGVKIRSLTDPFSLNDPSAKAAFYLFHSLPEWLAVVILFSNNVREVFMTGPFGDCRLSDMTEKQKKRWEKRQAQKRTEEKARKGLDFGVPGESPLQEKGMISAPPLVLSA